jgi:hypothetical protein
VPATDFPTLTVNGVGAMTAEKPGIVKSHKYRYLPAQPRERSQIKISAVQIVTVDNVRSLLG